MPSKTKWSETKNYDYPLTPDLIAQTPLANRDEAQLLVDSNGVISDMHIYDLPSLLSEKDLLVLNNTRVQKARLNLKKETGGKVEVLALAPFDSNSWSALINPSRRVPAGSLLYFDGEPVLEVNDLKLGEERRITPVGKYNSISELMEELGNIPLPPYITTPLLDAERYQTVYSKETASSVAAPTAGLHLSGDLLSKIKKQKIQTAELELEVGLATFSPIKTDSLEAHKMHLERYSIPPEVLELCQKTKSAGGRVVAVGTTVVRALESAAKTGKLNDDTKLFIQPGFEFQLVDALLTNFHLPRSTLLVLLAAFIGERWKELYTYAIKKEYRFLSFGDAMLVSA